MITRYPEQYLKHWLEKNRRKPLVLRGARQVGKSTLVRQFAAHQGLVLNEINLERHLSLNEVFKTFDLKRIVQELEGLAGRNIRESGSLLFLDEIQATPYALAALRYFYEELPELPVVAAGSLLEFALAGHSFSMPVGRVEYLHVGPVRFSEFIGCVDPGLEGWREAAGRFEKIPDTAHQRLFNQIPRNIGRKIKYVNLSREERSREIKAAVELLSLAQICQKVAASRCSGVPLSADASDDVFKLIFMDTGIVNFLCGGRWKDMSEASERNLVNEGPLAEQFAGQHLAYLDRSRPQLHYWIREGRANNAEVDYVVSQGKRMLPVEVKAGASGTLKSIQQFVIEKGSPQAIRFDLNQPSRMTVKANARSGSGVEEACFELLSLPLYAVEALSGPLPE